MAVFTWVEDYGSSVSVKPRVLVAQFGDGYSQRIPDGINNALKVGQVTFSLLNQTDYDAILSFLESHGGVTAFEWTPHGRSQGLYICKEWDSTFDYTGRISATFEEVPA